jgi:glyoxylase-like metal-dependent hydrolase (beta-lactamase superfamily II)
VAVRVAEDIYRVELPLPFALRSVNCYLLRDGDGWAVVDTGLHLPAGEAGWEAALAEVGARQEDISRLVLTHAHPDHYGMAGWLQERCRAPVLLSAAEHAFAQAQWHHGEAALLALGALFTRHGVPPDLRAAIAEDVAALRLLTHPTPVDARLLAAGETLTIGHRRWEAIATPGHSDGHLAFYCASERLLLCGDAVLTRISPNVGLWPHSRPDPLGAFLDTLGRLGALDVALALPGHGPQITEFHTRLAELAAHHEARLHTMETAVSGRSSAFDVCCAVFPVRDLSTHQVRFAMAETLAHLDHLVRRGRLALEDDGAVRFRPLY